MSSAEEETGILTCWGEPGDGVGRAFAFRVIQKRCRTCRWSGFGRRNGGFGRRNGSSSLSEDSLNLATVAGWSLWFAASLAAASSSSS
jgi:hypothetical protein